MISPSVHPTIPPRYIDTGFQYKHPAYFEFLNNRIRTRQRQSRSRWSVRIRAAARGRAARQKNASKMESVSILFIQPDSILDAKMFQKEISRNLPKKAPRLGMIRREF
eukprot:COSAG02_NODE_874_length_16292_cov_11.828630_11_plen_108_part_00